MRIRLRGFWVAITLLILVFAPYGAQAQSGGEKSFPGGFTLSGEWLAAWNSSADPYTEFGTPITQIITTATDERVLYTHQARFRETPEGVVVIDPLGKMLYTPGTPANFSLNTGGCRTHPDTGYRICYAFLQTYTSHGNMLGAPLSDPETMNGRIVQAFEYGWLEWRPENKPNQRVIFVDLGRIAYDLWENGHNGVATEGFNINRLINITAFAFVERSILPQGANQTLHVVARTEDFKPVANAIVQVALEFPDGRQEGLLTGYTDADGIARFTFPVEGLKIGQLVQITAALQSGSSSVEAGTSFRIWY